MRAAPVYENTIMNATTASQSASSQNSTQVVSYAHTTAQSAWPGVTRRMLAHDPNVMLCEHRFEAGTDLPAHAHPHEQITYILSGRLRFGMEGAESFEMTAGDSVLIPGHITHYARALEPTVVLDVFTPAREDYL